MAVGGVDTDYSLLVQVSRHWSEGALANATDVGNRLDICGCVAVEHVVETRKLREGEWTTGCCAQPENACMTRKHRALCGLYTSHRTQPGSLGSSP
ncbi:hypothetical protein HaLaN_15107 [Haematococcus lacustris]|uniref:Uncharacterized protein n=1 Tax=Haematococcus lacustris TaxID=44745 RepID=A0A699ZHH9_HAELA|nr:hypothetical protein HaLaN_15107 [Haematococcus lacustris]